MTPGTQAVDPPVRRSRRRLWVNGGIGLVMLLAVLAGISLWPRRRTVVPPLPDLTGVDPAVAALIREAHHHVVEQPASGGAWGHLGTVYLVHDFGGLASDCFTYAERLDPRQPRWPYLHGVPLLLSPHPEAGIPFLQRAVELCADRPLAPRLRLADALLEQGRLDEAQVNLERALRLQPSNHRAQLAHGRLAAQRAQWSQVLQRLEPCLNDPSARKHARILRAQALLALGRTAEARKEQQAAAALPEDEAWPDPYVVEALRWQRGLNVELESASALARGGHPEEAVRVLEDLGERYPKSVQVWLRLGDLQRRLGNEPQAERALETAVRTNPEGAESWFRLGSLRLLAHRPKEAADCFRRAMALKPDHAEAHYDLGLCLQDLGDPAAAANEFRAALRCRPDLEPARKALHEASASPGKKPLVR